MTEKKVTQKTIEKAVCIDWETSGSSFSEDSTKKSQGITVGAVVFDTTTFEEIDSIYLEIKFNESKYQWQDTAEAIHGKSRGYLKEHGMLQEEAAEKLIEFLHDHFGTSWILLLGHNVEFDRRFTNQLFSTVEFEFSIERENKNFTHIKLHNFMLDTSGAGFITTGLYKSDLLFEKMGFDKREAHNALEDARMTVATAGIMRQLCTLGFESLLNE